MLAKAPARPPLAPATTPDAKPVVHGRRPRIRCPQCGWEPRKDDRWLCRCGHVWNTFDTHGVCPGCGVVWEDTQCLSCHVWSPHDDWYEEDEAPPSPD